MSSLRTDSAGKPLRAVAAIVFALACTACTAVAAAAVVHPRVLDAARAGNVDVIMVFPDQSRPLLAPLRADADRVERRRVLAEALRARAGLSQGAVRNWLDARGITHRDFWIVNVMQATLSQAALGALAARGDIVRIDPNPQIPLRQPDAAEPIAATADATGVAWGVAKVEAPALWAEGFTGRGIVIAGEDTGFQWDHPVLKPQYRGWNGHIVHHAYNWHDAVHDAPAEPICGNDSPLPCDPSSHGTHTAGTFAGDDGPHALPRHQTGVAPGARWIGCRNMDRSGTGTPVRYIECMQWLLAPTNLQNANPDPSLAPDVVSNSWYCPPAEGCASGEELRVAVDNLVAAGIVYVAAAGNEGSSCSTIAGPPATYDASLVVGATDANDALAGFSSRGPLVTSALVRPDLSAPGVAVVSSIPGNSYDTKSGTSMAAPHVAGVVALLMSAYPWLKGDPAAVAAVLRSSAVTEGVTNTAGNTQICGGTPITQWPNYMVGYGRVDVLNALGEDIFRDGFGG